MLFNSLQFLVFLPVVTLLYFVIPHRARYIWLLFASYFFYMCWNPKYIVLIGFSTIVTYVCGLLVSKKRSKLILVGGLLLNLGVLAYFKYFNFFVGSITKILGAVGITLILPTVDVLLPVGISFYTFQALGYLIDVYRGDIKPEKNILKYALFVSFFPQLVAGPIERSGNLLKQFDEKHTFSVERLRDGFSLMLWGYFLKLMIADRAALFVDTVYGDIETYKGVYLIVATILFAVQIYCDFAGYTTIAMGAARVMGFTLTDNFQTPYFSTSVAEFWRRWHISLTGWFRDYVYIPLGGNRKGKGRKWINIVIVFALSGLWHGAGWTFVIWGLLNGLYQVIGEILNPLRKKMNAKVGIDEQSFSYYVFKVIGTFILVDFTWIFFRATDLQQAWTIVKSIFCDHNYWILTGSYLFNTGLSAANWIWLILSLAVLLVADIYKRKGVCVRQRIAAQMLPFRWCVYYFATILILIFGVWGSAYNAAAFIYFQF